MRRGRVASAALVGGVAAMGLLVWASAAGPVAFVGPSGRRLHRPDVHQNTSSAAPSSLSTGRPGHASSTHIDLSWIGDLLLAALVAVGLLVLGALVRTLWRRRPQRLPPAPEVDFDELPDEVRAARSVAADREHHHEVLASGTPRNGIVACWQRLEESIAVTGLARRPWETSSEYTVRVLHALDLDARVIGRLAELYREARFSEHPIGEEQRRSAREALDLLHAELAGISPAAS